MADTMARFYKGLIDSTVENIFQVTTAHTYVIRHIHISNPGASAYTVTMGVGTSATAGTNDTAANAFLNGFSIPAGSTYDWSGNLVMTSEEYFYAKSSSDDTLTLIISGVDTV